MTVQSKPSHFSIVTPLVCIEREIFIQPGDTLTTYYFTETIENNINNGGEGNKKDFTMEIYPVLQGYEEY